MKAFVTGGTGFIGKRVVSKLVDRGYQVNSLVRSGKGAEEMESLGAHPVWGDISDKGSMREGMRGSDVVFHIAGWYKLGARDQDIAYQINVEGTRNVLSLAQELGIPKIVYTSTVTVYGNTHGRLATELDRMPAGPFLTEYDRTKWKAHNEVVIPLLARGAPVIIVAPGAVYGPDDPSLVGDMMRRYYRGQFPILPGPEMTLTYAHVDDIAEGHILAAEKGKIGETYILAGPAVPMGEMVKIWSGVSGKPVPLAMIPARFVKPLAPVVGLIEKVLPLPEVVSGDTLSILDATYTASSEKARQKLGWKTRPISQGMSETFAEIAAHSPPPLPAAERQRRIAGLAIGMAVGLLVVWLLTRRRT
jgi:nucleoside-diphosphate-sugar epimerase